MSVITMHDEIVLTNALESMDKSAVRGGLSPSTVIAVIDDICAGLHLPVSELPQELRRLREDAQARCNNNDVGFREDSVADTIVMCGLWAI